MASLFFLHSTTLLSSLLFSSPLLSAPLRSYKLLYAPISSYTLLYTPIRSSPFFSSTIRSSLIQYSCSNLIWHVFLHLTLLHYNPIYSFPSDLYAQPRLIRLFFYQLWLILLFYCMIDPLCSALHCTAWSYDISLDWISLDQLSQIWSVFRSSGSSIFSSINYH